MAHPNAHGHAQSGSPPHSGIGYMDENDVSLRLPYVFGSSRPRDLSYLDFLPTKLRVYNTRLRSMRCKNEPNLSYYLKQIRQALPSSDHRIRDRSVDSASRYYVFGSSTPRDLSYLVGLPWQFRIYDVKLGQKSREKDKRSKTTSFSSSGSGTGRGHGRRSSSLNMLDSPSPNGHKVQHQTRSRSVRSSTRERPRERQPQPQQTQTKTRHRSPVDKKAKTTSNNSQAVEQKPKPIRRPKVDVNKKKAESIPVSAPIEVRCPSSSPNSSALPSHELATFDASSPTSDEFFVVPNMMVKPEINISTSDHQNQSIDYHRYSDHQLDHGDQVDISPNAIMKVMEDVHEVITTTTVEIDDHVIDHRTDQRAIDHGISDQRGIGHGKIDHKEFEGEAMEFGHGGLEKVDQRMQIDKSIDHQHIVDHPPESQIDQHQIIGHQQIPDHQITEISHPETTDHQISHQETLDHQTNHPEMTDREIGHRPIDIRDRKEIAHVITSLKEIIQEESIRHHPEDHNILDQHQIDHKISDQGHQIQKQIDIPIIHGQPEEIPVDITHDQQEFFVRQKRDHDHQKSIDQKIDNHQSMEEIPDQLKMDHGISDHTGVIDLGKIDTELLQHKIEGQDHQHSIDDHNRLAKIDNSDQMSKIDNYDQMSKMDHEMGQKEFNDGGIHSQGDHVIADHKEFDRSDQKIDGPDHNIDQAEHGGVQHQIIHEYHEEIIVQRQIDHGLHEIPSQISQISQESINFQSADHDQKFPEIDHQFGDSHHRQQQEIHHRSAQDHQSDRQIDHVINPADHLEEITDQHPSHEIPESQAHFDHQNHQIDHPDHHRSTIDHSDQSKSITDHSKSISDHPQIHHEERRIDQPGQVAQIIEHHTYHEEVITRQIDHSQSDPHQPIDHRDHLIDTADQSRDIDFSGQEILDHAHEMARQQINIAHEEIRIAQDIDHADQLIDHKNDLITEKSDHRYQINPDIRLSQNDHKVFSEPPSIVVHQSGVQIFRDQYDIDHPINAEDENRNPIDVIEEEIRCQIIQPLHELHEIKNDQNGSGDHNDHSDHYRSHDIGENRSHDDHNRSESGDHSQNGSRDHNDHRSEAPDHSDHQSKSDHPENRSADQISALETFAQEYAPVQKFLHSLFHVEGTGLDESN